MAKFKEDARCHRILYKVYTHKPSMDIDSVIQLDKTRIMKVGFLIKDWRGRYREYL